MQDSAEELDTARGEGEEDGDVGVELVRVGESKQGEESCGPQRDLLGGAYQDVHQAADPAGV